MNFWNKFGYLLLILIYIDIISSEYEFHTMPLGHTGLLIFWDPQGAYYFDQIFVKYHATKKIAMTNISEKVFAVDGQYKLNSILIENTEYEIAITIPTGESNKTQIIKAKTGLKENTVPEKPDFTWSVYRDDTNKEGPKIRIAWIPCGKQRNCHGNEAGTHFAVRYKVLDMRETFTVVQNTQVYVDIPYIYAGRIYEVIVSSINGDFRTDSDSQEIFHVPTSSPVHSVNVLTLSNTSIYISWEKPRQIIGEVLKYYLYISTAINSSHKFHSNVLPIAMDRRCSMRLNGLTPNTHFTISIVPYTISMNDQIIPGFAYTFDYLIPIVPAINSTLAKPDFKFISINPRKCEYNMYWIPCGETNDCKNLTPGSGFEVKIQNGNDEPKTILENTRDWTEINTRFDSTSRITAKSVNEFNQSSESVTKTISCDHP